jgi:G3E family GTPase
MANNNIPERVSSLEATMESLSRDVRDTNENLMQLAKTMETGFENMRGILSEQKQTNWPLLMSLFGVIVTVSGWWVSYSTMDIRTELAVVKYHLKIEETIRQKNKSALESLINPD